MQPHDTYGPPMTQDDTTKSRCVMRQVTAESRLARRMTQMTQNCTIYASRARPRMRTRMTKSCFSVTFASCVIGGDSTLWPTRHVGPCRDRSRDAQTGHLVGRSPQTPTWAAWAAHVAADDAPRPPANRYLAAQNGPKRQREQPQYPSDLLPVDRRACGSWQNLRVSKEPTMRPTPRETDAARALADALIELFIACEAGHDARRQRHLREEVAARVEHVQPPIVPQPPRPDRPGKPPERLLLTARQAAEYLSIGARLLWSLSAPRGPLPVVRLGRAIRYAVPDLDAAMQRMRVKPRKDSSP